jgi:hypothetical protein
MNIEDQRNDERYDFSIEPDSRVVPEYYEKLDLWKI